MADGKQYLIIEYREWLSEDGYQSKIFSKARCMTNNKKAYEYYGFDIYELQADGTFNKIQNYDNELDYLADGKNYKRFRNLTMEKIKNFPDGSFFECLTQSNRVVRMKKTKKEVIYPDGRKLTLKQFVNFSLMKGYRLPDGK